ncbi:MAG: tail fiber domain-containing protein [Betaproteobacteria bacterium]|nr:tail fiber domain-containing protein [Betaproteobacteria bacterium]
MTGIIAGTGLSGGAITTTGTIGIADGGVGTAQLANGAVTTAKMAANGCTTGQVLQFNGSAWACASVASAGTVTSIATGTGLTGGPITATGTIGLAATQLLPTAACSANQVPKWSGSAWTCAADATGTVNGLVQGGNAFGAVASLGTNDNQAVEIIVNNTRAVRLEPDALSPIVILGSSVNQVMAGAGGGAIGGGGAPNPSALPGEGNISHSCGVSCSNRVMNRGGTVGGGFANRAGDSTGSAIDRLAPTVGGGLGNIAGGEFSVVSGGDTNRALGSVSVVAGGRYNEVLGLEATIGGGIYNAIADSWATVGGGNNNVVVGIGSTIPGGIANRIDGNYSFAAGTSAGAMHHGAFVWADSNGFLIFESTAPNQFSARATGGVRFVTAIDGFGAPVRTFTLGNDGRLTMPTDGSVYLGSSRFTHATGARNAFTGVTAGNAVSSGFENAALGHEALLANTIGAGNTAVGYRAMASMTESFNSTAVGAQALANATSAGNIALGSFAGFNITTGANNIAIGSPGVAGDADTTRLGGGQSRAFIAGVRGVTTGANDAVAVMVDSQGQLGTVSSSRRFKDDIADMGEASGGLHDLRPVTFTYKADGDATGKRVQYGLIAEEVAEIYPGLVARSPDGQAETVLYHFLAPMLVNEVQKQQRTIDAQRAELEALRADVAAMKRALGFAR